MTAKTRQRYYIKTMQNIVETFDLTKKFSSKKGYQALFPFRQRADITAVDAVTLQIRPGELFGLLGFNGAGKSTLIKMLCTLILPSSGRAQIAGHDVVKEAAVVKRLIGLVDTQERSFFWRLTGQQNLEFFAALHGLHGAQARARIAHLVDLLNLGEYAGRRVMTYSSGIRQRLAIARSLLTAPPVLFMDEPTRSLDPASARQLRQFIRTTLVDRLGHTVVLVTHQLKEAETLCDRVAIMNRGKIVACGPVTHLKQKLAPRHRYCLQVQYLPTSALPALKSLPGVVELTWSNGTPHTLTLNLTLANERQTLPPLIHLIVSQGGQIQHCRAWEVSLEEAFLQLTQHQNGP